MWTVEGDHLNGHPAVFRTPYPGKSRAVPVVHVEVRGCKACRWQFVVERPKNVHRRPATEPKDSGYRMGAISKKRTHTQGIVYTGSLLTPDLAQRL